MEYLRIGALTPPGEGRSQWARDLLLQAIEDDLEPLIVPEHKVVGFTLNAPPHLSIAIKAKAERSKVSVATVSAGLIEAVLKNEVSGGPAAPTPSNITEKDARISLVRPILHPMVEAIRANMPQGKIFFAEAATGTGKGSLIACLALDAALDGKRALISAPLPVIWQLTQELARFEDAAILDIGVLLGRPNFVDPDELALWANTTGSQTILEWIAAGGTPVTDATRNLGNLIGIELKWLLDDALALDDEIPTSQVMLSEPAEGTVCPAEDIYQKLREKTHTASILMCSHHFMAAHYRLMAMNCDGILPFKTDVLLVDEAHQLEDAFAAVNTETLHLHAMGHALGASSVPKKSVAKAAIEELGALITATALADEYGARSLMGDLDRFGGLEDAASTALVALNALKPKKSDLAMAKTLRHAKGVIKSVLSRQSTVRVELTPVKKYAVLSAGKANLEKPLKALWESCSSAVLVSATLTGSLKANLTGWKLAIPSERLMVPTPVTPSWIYKPVELMNHRLANYPNTESDEWHDEVASQLLSIAESAVGGTQVLLTAYASIEALTERLRDVLGDRLIVQSPAFPANACAHVFKNATNRPVWLGTGAAWTGFNLSNSAVPVGEDFTLTDLVVPRLPYGTVRTLSHARRSQIAGPVVGHQEATWRLQQGLGRLVRREGVLNRRLWVLDKRIDDLSPQTKGMRELLSRYNQYH